MDFIRAPDFIEACWESWERSARLNLNPILSHPENSQKVTGSLNKIYALNAAKVLTRMEFKQVAIRKVTMLKIKLIY